MVSITDNLLFTISITITITSYIVYYYYYLFIYLFVVLEVQWFCKQSTNNKKHCQAWTINSAKRANKKKSFKYTNLRHNIGKHIK